MAYAVTKKQSRGNAGAVESVESQHPGFPLFPQAPWKSLARFPHSQRLRRRTRSTFLISVDGCRSLRPLSSRQRRFAPIMIGFAPESLIGFTSESLIDFVGIPICGRFRLPCVVVGISLVAVHRCFEGD